MTLQSKRRHDKSEKVDKLVTINVSGRRFCTWDSTLKKYPDTLLGSDEIKLYFDDAKKEYFLDRDPHLFRYILNFYRLGKLHFSYEDCIDAFHDELRFFGIHIEEINECCWEEVHNLSKKCFQAKHVSHQCCSKQRGQRRSHLRRCLWNLLENTETTCLGKYVQSFIGVLIYLSVVCTIIETISCSKKHNKTCEEKYPTVFFTFDAFCMGIFTVEYLLRLYASDKRWKFITNKMNMIDVMAVAPFYILLILKLFSLGSLSAVENASGLMVLRMLRVFRIFKLSRHSKHMRQMGRALKRAVVDLGFLFFAFLLTNILFSSVLYYIEQMDAEKTEFKSIPDGMWYTIITMMTVG